MKITNFKTTTTTYKFLFSVLSTPYLVLCTFAVHSTFCSRDINPYSQRRVVIIKKTTKVFLTVFEVL